LGLALGSIPEMNPISQSQDFYKYFKCLNYFIMFESVYIMSI